MLWLLPWRQSMSAVLGVVLAIAVHEAVSRTNSVDLSDPRIDPRLRTTVENWRREEGQRRLLSQRRLSHFNEEASGLWIDKNGKMNPPRHASIHWRYTPSSGATEDISAWYNEVEITSRDEDSFYSVNGHAYGYAGIQSVDMEVVDGKRKMKKGKVLFSIWDQLCTGDEIDCCPADKQVIVEQCCDECVCERFGGEGTGGKSGWVYSGWQLNAKYSFLTMAEPYPGNQVRFRGYFYAPELGDWKMLGAFIVNRGAKKWGIHDCYSFVEQWTYNDPEYVRWAKFGPVMTRRGLAATDPWDPVYEAWMLHTNRDGTSAGEDTTHINANMSGSIWEMGIGGDVVKTAMIDEVFQLATPAATCPGHLIAFVGNETLGTLPTADAPIIIPQIVCGSHKADYSCENCTQGNGKGWCNKACGWKSSCTTSEKTLSCCEPVPLDCSGDHRRLSPQAPGAHARRMGPAMIAPVICHGGGTGTTTPFVPGFRSTARAVVVLTMTVQNVNYATLSADTALSKAFLDAAAEGIAAMAGTDVTTAHVTVTMSAGSVNLEAKIEAPGSMNSTWLQYTIQNSSTLSSIVTEVSTKLSAVAGISAATTGTLAVGNAGVSSEMVAVNMAAASKRFFFIAHASGPAASVLLILLVCLWPGLDGSTPV